MVKCETCGAGYNTDLLDTCPLCKVRQETALESEALEGRVPELANQTTPQAHDTVGVVTTEDAALDSGGSYPPESDPGDVELVVATDETKDPMSDDEQVKRLLAAIVQQNETTVIQLKKARASLFTVNVYLFLLVVVYPILGLIVLIAVSA